MESPLYSNSTSCSNTLTLCNTNTMSLRVKITLTNSSWSQSCINEAEKLQAISTLVFKYNMKVDRKGDFYMILSQNNKKYVDGTNCTI